MSEKLETIQQVQEALENLSYATETSDNALICFIGGNNAPFKSVLTIDPASNVLHITCQIMQLGQVMPENREVFYMAALDINSVISPFSVALLTGQDDESLDDDDSFPIVLTNSVPLGDFSTEELESAMSSLLNGILSCQSVIELGMANEVVAV